MIRKLASVQEIKEVNPIRDADNIEHIKVLGWHLVAQKNQFKPGDKCVYVEIDSVLPEWPEFEFLRGCCYIEKNGFKGFLIKTARRRGVVSQGIAFPISLLDGLLSESEIITGLDVSDLLNVVKYDPPVPACLSGYVAGNFPSFLPTTDEYRVQAVPTILERHKGETWFYDEKLNGTSATYGIKDGEFFVCSRSMQMKYNISDNYNNTYCRIADKYNISDRLEKASKALGNIMVQGEIVGPGIEKNPYKLKDHDFYIFNIYNIDDSKYYNYGDFVKIASDLGLKTVPILGSLILDHTVEDLEELASGPSKINNDVGREGIILRPIKEDTDIETGRLSIKVIPPKSLL